MGAFVSISGCKFFVSPEPKDRPTVTYDKYEQANRYAEFFNGRVWAWPHFTQDSSIAKYGMVCVLSGATDDRADEVEKAYGIKLSLRAKTEEGNWFACFSEFGIGHEKWRESSAELERALGGERWDRFPAEADCSGDASTSDLEKLAMAHEVRKGGRAASGLSRKNYTLAEAARALPIGNVLKELGRDAVAFDNSQNFCPTLGDSFQSAVSALGGVGEAFKFFREKFNLEFEEPTRDVTVTVDSDGVPMTVLDGMVESGNGYSIQLGAGATHVDAKFFVRYRKFNPDGTISISVRAVRADGTHSTFDLPAQVGGNSGAAEFAKYGVHVVGSAILRLHMAISYTRVPTIESVVGYGHHPDHGIVIFRNGIFDYGTGRFSKRPEGAEYFPTYDGRCFRVSDAMGRQNPIENFVPDFNDQCGVVEMGEAFDEIGPMYKNCYGKFTAMYAVAATNYGLLKDKKELKFPLLFLHGTTGAGKTTLSRVIQNAFGFRNEITSNWKQTSPFVITSLLSSLNDFPVYFTEFRETGTDSKENILRSAFDRTGNMKGRADQSVVHYKYSALPILEGEEMAHDGALRTRCVQLFMKGTNKNVKVDKVLAPDGAMSSLYYSASTRSARDDFFTLYEEGRRKFKTPSIPDRIADNAAMIYAGVMCFDPSKKDEYVSILKFVVAEQFDDYMQNGTHTQVVRLVSAYLSSKWADAFADKDYVAVPWESVREYSLRNRNYLTLGNLDSYRLHLEELGMEVRMFDYGNGAQTCLVVAKKEVPHEFLAHPTIYKECRHLIFSKDVAVRL